MVSTIFISHLFLSLGTSEFAGGMVHKELSRESVEKIRDVLSSMLGSAVKYGFLAKNPADGLHVTPEKGGTGRQAIHSTGSSQHWSG